MIQRLVISSCRGKIDINAFQRIKSSLSILQQSATVIKTGFPVNRTCIIHKRSFHDSTNYLEKINSKKNGIGIINDISTFQIKKRLSRRNRIVINDDKILRPNVSLLYEELEYCFLQVCNEMEGSMYKRNFFVRHGL